MLFSEHYHIKEFWEKEWYNPWMESDIRLFLDPYLIENSTIPEFLKSREKINHFFRFVINKIGEYTLMQRKALLMKYMKNVLIFPEVFQLCLGYSKDTRGSGTGGKFASDVYHAIIDIVEELKLNPDEFTHVEVLTFFSKGVSHDGISDITANLLKEEIINYTQRICTENKIPMKKLPISHFKFNFEEEHWEDGYFDLPENPHTKEAILLVPKEFLRQSPTLNFNLFTKFLIINEAEYLRERLNIKVTNQLDKDALIRAVKDNPNRLKNYFSSVYGEGKIKKDYYNYTEDKNFIYYPRIISEEIHKLISPIKSITIHNPEELFNFVKVLVDNFKQMIEKQGCYKILRNPSNNIPFKETFIQDIFFMTIKIMCENCNIDISRESKAANGRIEFKFSIGHNCRTHLEIKLAKNQNLNGGYQKQLPEYMIAEKILKGVYLVVSFSEEDDKKIDELKKLTIDNKYNSLEITIMDVDAKEKSLPSKIK